MLRPWDLRIVLDRTSDTPAWLQIANAVVEAIRRGRLAPGTALPGTRELAARVAVNRKTVQQSYDELVAQGWLTAETKRGTFVSAQLPLVGPQITTTAPPVTDAVIAPRRAAPALTIAIPRAGIISFDDGLPDTRLMPAEFFARAWRRALLEAAGRNRLGYGDPRGCVVLREAVAAMLRADRGLDCGPDNICITRGSQMGIFLAARLLTTTGDRAVFEALSYPPAREAFRAAGAEILGVGLDDLGMRMDDLETHCRNGEVRAVYITPHHQFPSTVVLPQQRRIQLSALAAHYGFAIVEDDYDHEFHFAHRPMLPLASVQGFGRLLYIGSLSKLLSPSLRIGYLVAAPAIAARAGAEICLIDRQGDPVTEAAAAALMTSGALKSHTRKVLRIYAARREFLASLLQTELAHVIDFILPQGGLALWIKFAPHIDVAKLAARGLQTGIGLTPGQTFATNGVQTNGMRIGFGSLNETELAEAVRRLKFAL